MKASDLHCLLELNNARVQLVLLELKSIIESEERARESISELRSQTPARLTVEHDALLMHAAGASAKWERWRSLELGQQITGLSILSSKKKEVSRKACIALSRKRKIFESLDQLQKTNVRKLLKQKNQVVSSLSFLKKLNSKL